MPEHDDHPEPRPAALPRLEIPVETGRGERYPVHVGAGLFAGEAAAILDRLGPSRRVVLSSPPIWKLHGQSLSRALGGEVLLVPDGERAKTLRTVSRVYDALVELAADRATLLVVVGGGVLGDLGGFAAASYLRGIDLVHVPTTLLAQVDSAVGGKVGVNHRLGKNLIGAFHAPRAVLADPTILGTLPRRELRSGLYEVIKYGAIASPELLPRLAASLDGVLAKDPATLTPIIAECVGIKAAIVGADERESGVRRTLNFGHTVGHALEAATAYARFRHGEAVAYGMLAAAAISGERGLLAPEAIARLTDVIRRLGPMPAVADLAATDVLDAIRHDKKLVRDRLHFVLLSGLGRTVIVDDVGPAELGRALGGIGIKA